MGALARTRYANAYVRELSKEEGKEKKQKKKKRAYEEREVAYVPRRKPVGNCADRNADADKGNPYDRLWYGYL